MSQSIFSIDTMTTETVRGSDCGGGVPEGIEISAENITLFDLDGDSIVTLMNAYTRGDDIGSGKNDGIWDASISLSLITTPPNDDGTKYNVVSRYNLTDPSGGSIVELQAINEAGESLGVPGTWGEAGFRGFLTPSVLSAYPAYGATGWPIRYWVRVTYGDPPVDPTPNPADDHIYAPTNLAVTFDLVTAIATLTWEDHSDNELGFVIERMEVTGDSVWHEISRTLANAVTWDDEEVLPGTVTLPEYQYRVYAYKSSLRSNDSNIVGLTVDGEELTELTAATAPIVDAGQSVSAFGPPPSTVTLHGVVTRGALNGVLTYAWAQVEGPTGNATIVSPTSIDTDITFAAYVPGTYTFELTVTTEDDLAGPSLVSKGQVSVIIAPTIAPRVSGGFSQTG